MKSAKALVMQNSSVIVYVHAEFSAMVDQDAIQTMKSRWMKYVPDLLHFEDEDGEDASYKALHILDKRLRGTSIGAKSRAVFAEYAVSCT